MPAGVKVSTPPPKESVRICENWPFEDMVVGECRRFEIGGHTNHSRNLVSRNAFWSALRKVKKAKPKWVFQTQVKTEEGTRYYYCWRLK